MDTMKALRRAWLVRLKNRDLHCALCGCLIESRKDLSVEHYVPKTRASTVFSQNMFNLRPALAIINNIKGDLLPCEWEVLKSQKCLHALQHYNLTAPNKILIIRALDRFATEKDMLNPCQDCILSSAKEQCDAARNMAAYKLPKLSCVQFR